MGDLTNIKILCREIIKEVEERDTKIHKLEERIDKALEYIEKNSDDMHTYISQILTDILKGVDKE